MIYALDTNIISFLLRREKNHDVQGGLKMKSYKMAIIM